LVKSGVRAEAERALEKLFLCHYNADAAEVGTLAEELQLRGVAPWIDKESGFSVGDENAGEAERAIDEDCFGLLFYATPEAFGRDFIRQIEINKALRRKEEDPSFVLFAVPRCMGFGELSERSIESFGVDLAVYASREIKGPGGKEESSLRLKLGAVATDVLDKVLARAREGGVADTLQMQFSTRERLADEPGDVLCVDAVQLLERATDPASRTEAWYRIHGGLMNMKRAVSRHFGRPRLRVHGSKHLTAAYVLGYTFPSTTYELEIRTKQDYWATDREPTHGDLLRVTSQGGSVGSENLYVEISTGDKPVREAVRRYVRRTCVSPLRYLRLTPGPERELAPHLNNADACAIARQLRRELAREISEHDISEVHIFAAVPQGLAMMIGHNLNAMPPVQLYEYDGREYHPSYRLGQ
jgi:hypothetical protein